MPIGRNASGQGAKQKAEAQEQKTPLPSIEARINRINDNPSSNILADASITIGGSFAIHGIKVMRGPNGPFASMPSRPYKDAQGETKYAETFHPVTSEARYAIGAAVKAAYDQALSQHQDAGIGRSAPQQNM